MQKYYARTLIEQDHPAVTDEDTDGYSCYVCSEVDDTLAAKDRDLADANHALLLANNSADAFKRVAEQRQGEIEELTRKLAVAEDQSFQWRQKYENLDNYIAGCLA